MCRSTTAALLIHKFTRIQLDDHSFYQIIDDVSTEVISLLGLVVKKIGKSSELVQCAMLKAAMHAQT